MTRCEEEFKLQFKDRTVSIGDVLGRKHLTLWSYIALALYKLGCQFLSCSVLMLK